MASAPSVIARNPTTLVPASEQVLTLLEAAEAAVGGTVTVPAMHGNRVYAARVEGTGSVAAEVKIWGAAGTAGPVLLGTITLAGTDEAADGFASDAPWPEVFAELVSVTGDTVTVTMGV